MASVRPTAIGATAAMVPIDVPMAVAIKAVIRNKPGSTNDGGIILRPRLTVASTPPIALATLAKPPASRKISSKTFLPVPALS